MKVVISIAVSIAVGLVVFAVASYLMGLYTWTAIHSGWSQAQIDRFYLALRVGAVILGIVAASVLDAAAKHALYLSNWLPELARLVRTPERRSPLRPRCPPQERARSIID